RVGTRTTAVSNSFLGYRSDPEGHEFPDWRIHQELKALATAVDSVLDVERWIDGGAPDEPRADPGASEPFGLTTSDLAEVVIEVEGLPDEFDSRQYKIVLHGDGRVEWDGISRVREVGRREGKIPVDDVRRVLRRFERGRFLELSSVEFPGKQTCC